MVEVEMILKRFALFLLMVTATASAFGQARLADAEYKILSEMIKQVSWSENPSDVIMLSTTAPQDNGRKERKWRALSRAFVKKNRTPVIVENKFGPFEKKVVFNLLDRSKYDELIEEGKAEWLRLSPREYFSGVGVRGPLYRLFPGSGYVCSVSRVAFLGRYAMASASCSEPMSGFGNTWVFKKVNGRWELETADFMNWNA